MKQNDRQNWDRAQSIDIRLVGETGAHHAHRRKLSEPILFCKDRDLSHLARPVQVYDFAHVRDIDR